MKALCMRACRAKRGLAKRLEKMQQQFTGCYRTSELFGVRHVNLSIELLVPRSRVAFILLGNRSIAFLQSNSTSSTNNNKQFSGTPKKQLLVAYFLVSFVTVHHGP
jgi:hypothetical protein